MKKKDLTIGILGGMGPLAGVELQRRIILKTPAKKDQDHIKMVCFTNPEIKDRTKSITINSEFSSDIIASFRSLKKLSVGLGVIACNTAHVEYEEIASRVSFPLLNIIEETANFIAINFSPAKPVGLLATDGTIMSGIYHVALGKSGFRVIIPAAKIQNQVMEAIYGPQGIKAGFVSGRNQRIIEKAVQSLRRAGAEAVVLGCTELSLINSSDQRVVDPMDVISEKIVAAVYND